MSELKHCISSDNLLSQLQSSLDERHEIEDVEEVQQTNSLSGNDKMSNRDRTNSVMRTKSLLSPFSDPIIFDYDKIEYDYSKSTEENYMTDRDVDENTGQIGSNGSAEDGNVFVGKYASQRSKLDYSYHKHYIPERQLFHDQLIDGFDKTVVTDSITGRKCEVPLDNWIVFTAGPMGAGKSRVLSYLYSKGYFPLESFVRVDPDSIRVLLPETETYIHMDATSAGRKTQKEVNYISEVLTMEALQNHKNVLVDGSLRDAQWYFQYFNTLKNTYPRLKIGILHVTAKTESILERARKRGLVTGRVVPPIVIQNTIEAIPKSLALLAPLADLVCVFDNDDENPLSIVHLSERSEGKECRAQPTNVFYESDWTEDGNKLDHDHDEQSMEALQLESEVDGHLHVSHVPFSRTPVNQHNGEIHTPPMYTFEQFKAVWNMSCPMPGK